MKTLTYLLMFASAISLPMFDIALAEPTVRSIHGDWQLRCDDTQNSELQCGLTQMVTASDKENVGLTVTVLKSLDKKTRIMRVLVPSGVLLPAGLGLRVDDTDFGRAGFVRCFDNIGCVSETIFDDGLLEKFRTGKTATFIIFLSSEQGVGIPVSLSGFNEGFQKLP
jgi:invasion protein IalB